MDDLRAFCGPGAVPLAHALGKEYEFFACDMKGTRRSLAAFPSIHATVIYDYAAAKESLDVRGFDSPERIKDLDFAGARLGAYVALFHRDASLARSSVSFRVDAPGKLKYLVTGLAPGDWDIWFQGFRENTLTVAPREACLYFEGDPGGYFLRHV